MTLNQLGVGPKDAFSISGEEETWDDFLQGAGNLETVKQYIYLKTRYVFDPPSTGALTEAYKEMMKECEWRLNVEVDSRKWPR